jgi:hypothetical protein
MDVAGLSDERGIRSVAGHVSNGVRDRRGRPPHRSAVRPGPVNVRQPGANADSPAAAAAADHRQADYFRRVLAQSSRHIDHRLGEYHKAIATAEAAGDAEGAGSLRRMARAEEQERQTLEGLIDKLQRRFPPRTWPAVR